MFWLPPKVDIVLKTDVTLLEVGAIFHLKELEFTLFRSLTVLSEPKNWALEDFKSLNLSKCSVLNSWEEKLLKGLIVDSVPPKL